MANRPPAARRPQDDTPEPESPIDRAMVKWTRAVALFTFLLFVTSAVANFFIYEQWQESIIAQKDSRDQTRALVVLDQIGAFPGYIVDGRAPLIGFVASFRNIGGTRTQAFSAWASIHYFQGSVPNSQDFSKPWTEIITHNSVIAAGSLSPMSPVTLLASEVDDIKATLGVAIFWGHAEWSDIFDKSVTHYINFCLTVVPQSAPVGVAAINGLAGFSAVPYKPECNNST